MRAVTLGTPLLAIIGLAACAEQPFFRVDQPTASGGVTMALLGQRCGRRNYDRLNDVLSLEMRVQVSNSGPTSVEIAPQRFFLLVDGDATAPEAPSATEMLAPGATKVLDVRFFRFGDATCNEQMRLSVDHAVKIDSRDVSLRPLSFVPSTSDV